MTVYALLFYIIAAFILASTAVAVTRRHLVHAAIFLALSFFGSAMLFYLLGAPLLAVLEVIVYVGAIMVLFLFVIMMVEVRERGAGGLPRGQLAGAAALGVVYLAAAVMLVRAAAIDGNAPLKAAVAEPGVFGQYLFQQHWLSIEIASFLLLIALVGVLHLGRDIRRRQTRIHGEKAS